MVHGDSLACLVCMQQKAFDRRSRIGSKFSCSNCKSVGHLVGNCLKLIGYLDWFKGAKDKRSSRFTAHVEPGTPLDIVAD